MTDIQSLLNLMLTKNSGSASSQPSNLSHLTSVEANQLQQLLSQIKLPQQEAIQLLTLLTKRELPISQVSLSSKLLTFTFPKLSPNPITIELLPQTRQLQSHSGQLSGSDKLEHLSLSIPHKDIKLPLTTLLNVLKASVNETSSNNEKIELPAKLIKTIDTLQVSVKSIGLTISLPTSIRPLVADQQSAFVDIKGLPNTFQLTVKLDRQAGPIHQQNLPTKKVIELIDKQNISSKLQFHSNALELKIANQIVNLGIKPSAFLPPEAKPLFKFIGDKPFIRLPSTSLKLPLLSTKPIQDNNLQRVIVQPPPPQESLTAISKLTATPVIFSDKIMTPLFNSIRHFFRNAEVIHIQHANDQNHMIRLNLPTNNKETNQNQAVRTQYKANNVLGNAYDTITYSRPIIKNESVGLDINGINKSQFTNSNSLFNNMLSTARHNTIASDSVTLMRNIDKSPLPLSQLVNQTFERFISEKQPSAQTINQIKSLVNPTKVNVNDFLSTPWGILQHSNITIAANGLSQRNQLPPEQQGKLESILPLLFNLTRQMRSKKGTLTARNSTVISSQIQQRLVESIEHLQKSLRANSNIAATQTTNNTENAVTSFQLMLPIVNDDTINSLPIAIECEQQKENNGQQRSMWRISLVLNINNQPLFIQAELQNKQLGLNFISDNDGTLASVKKRSPSLEAKLAEHGIKVIHSNFVVDKMRATNNQHSGIINLKI